MRTLKNLFFDVIASPKGHYPERPRRSRRVYRFIIKVIVVQIRCHTRESGYPVLISTKIME